MRKRTIFKPEPLAMEAPVDVNVYLLENEENVLRRPRIEVVVLAFQQLLVSFQRRELHVDMKRTGILIGAKSFSNQCSTQHIGADYVWVLTITVLFVL